MSKAKADPEMEKFQAELLQSVREYKAGKFARKTEVTPTDALQARARMALSQSQFAKLLGVSVRTLQEWEQGRRSPSRAAKTLISIAETRPEVLRELATAA